MKRTPLRPRRLTPRRTAPERVEHQRIKPKAGAAPTAAEKRHMARVATMRCLVGHGCYGRIEVHHVHSDGLKRIARSHRRVVPLCGEALHKVGREHGGMVVSGAFFTLADHATDDALLQLERLLK